MPGSGALPRGEAPKGWVAMGGGVGGEGGTVASEPTFEASCSIPICVSRSRRRRRGAGRPTSPHSPRPHTGGGALTTTKTRTKALLGAAALQVAAVVTFTDWSSNGNPRPTPSAQSRLWGATANRGVGGPRSRAEALSQVGSGGGRGGSPFQGRERWSRGCRPQPGRHGDSEAEVRPEPLKLPSGPTLGSAP